MNFTLALSPKQQEKHTGILLGFTCANMCVFTSGKMSRWLRCTIVMRNLSTSIKRTANFWSEIQLPFGTGLFFSAPTSGFGRGPIQDSAGMDLSDMRKTYKADEEVSLCVSVALFAAFGCGAVLTIHKMYL